MKNKWLFLINVVVIILLASACGSTAKPEPGAQFSGTIDMGANAKSGSIHFSISSGGDALENLEIVVNDLTCKKMTVGKARDSQAGPNIPVANGRFNSPIPAIGRISENYNLGTSPDDFPVIDSLDTVGKIDGAFASPTQASGKITIFMWVIMTDRACELGTFDWVAEVK